MNLLAVLVQQVLKQHPLGLIFDIDGTLSPIASTPNEAYLPQDVRPLLIEAKEQAYVAIITGRAVESGAAIVNVSGLTYIGSHGLEWCDDLPSLHPVQIPSEVMAYIKPGKSLLDMVEQELSSVQGIIVEHKRVGGAVHYRLCHDPEYVKKKIWSLLDEPARKVGMRLSEGKRVIEIKPYNATNKGRALRQFVERFKLQSVVFAGDDSTDLDAIKELAKLRMEGKVTLSIVVQHADTLPALLQQADVVVQGVNGMIELLREMVKYLRLQSEIETNGSHCK